MAKTLANYDPLVQIPSGMTPAGADFPIVESHDILVGENDKRLDAKLDDIDSAIGNVGQTPIATQLSSKVNTGDIVTSVAATGSTSNNKIPSETAVRAAIEAKTINVDSTVTQGSTNAVSGGAVHTQLATKQDVLTFDTTPTASSSNPVTSGGVKSALDTKQDALTFDTTPTASSSNPVTSGGVKAALDTKQNTLTYETTPIVGSVNPVTSTGIRNAIDTAAAQNLGAMQAQYAEFVADADAVLDRASSLSNGMVACSDISAETTVGDTRILLYTGTTNANYTNGHWYYNSAPSNAAPSWTDGGAVGSAPTIDNTLAIDGAAANSKSVGDAIENIVTISNTQPGSNSGNKVWIKETTSEEVQVPTYAEHIAKANKADIATNNESDNGSGTISASKAYAIGDHFYINNTNTSSENYGVSTLYKATAAIASGDAIVVGTNCEASKVADEITSLSNDIGTLILLGGAPLTKANFESGTYSNTGAKSSSNRNIRSKISYPVVSGDKLVCSATSPSLYLAYYIVDSTGTCVESAGTSYKVAITASEITFAHAGDLYIVVANGPNYGNSSVIDPDDMQDCLTVQNTYVKRMEAPILNRLNGIDANIDVVNTASAYGAFDLHSADFEQGSYTSTGGNENGTRVIRSKQIFEVIPGDKISCSATNPSLYLNYYIVDGMGTCVEQYGESYKKIIQNEKLVLSHAGTLYITVANGVNYGNSSNISPSDMQDCLSVENTYAKRIEYDIASVRESEEYIYTEQVNVTDEASSVSYLYHDMTFKKGYTYIVKAKFTAFSASTNRKFSIRTTTAKYYSAAYCGQVIVSVDGTAPTIGHEYEYAFVCTKDAKFLAIELSVNAASACVLKCYTIKAEDALAGLDDMAYLTAKDIVSLNHDLPRLIRQGQNPFNRNTTAPLTLLHFSDIHGSGDNLQRFVDLKESLRDLLDDTICTGDMASANWSSTAMDFWNGVDGAEKILICVGNHDLADGTDGYSTDQIGQTVAYQTYISPYLSDWTGVTSAGQNLTYWYKDYANRKVRLIALNYLLTGDEQTAQNTWLVARLAEAKSLGYVVVIAEHVPVGNWHNIDCNFTIIGKAWTYNEYPTLYLDTVQDFIDNGGEFACYIAGHSHSDYVGYNASYPEQLCIAVTTALTTRYDNDQRRATGEKSQDAANVVLIDTITKTVKLIRVGADMDTYMRGRHILTIRYTDKQIIAQS